MALESGQRVLKAHRQLIDDYLKEQLNAEIFYLPNINTLCNLSNEFRKDIVFVYDSSLPGTGKEGDVTEGMKILQGMALDGLFYAYNLEKDTLDLYTANDQVLNSLHGGGGFNKGKTYTFNMNGVVNAMRVDVEYQSPRTGEYNAKATRLTGQRVLDHENFLFIPYNVIARFIQMFKSMLGRGRVVKIVHNADGAPHERLVSLNPAVLSEFNEDSAFTSSLEMVDFRYNGAVYLPVVGAPSTTSGITRVDFSTIDRVEAVHRRTVDVEPADNNPWSMIEREITKIFVRQVFASEDDRVKPQLWKLLKKLGNEIPFDSEEYAYIRAVHDLDSAEREKLWNLLPPKLTEYGDRIANLLDRYEAVPVPETVPELQSLMLDGVYRIVVMRSKGGSFYTTYATNNNQILEMAYGKNYISKYEDENVRLRSFLSAYDKLGVGALGGGGGGIGSGSNDHSEPYAGDNTGLDGVDIREGLRGYGLTGALDDVAGEGTELMNVVVEKAKKAREDHVRGTTDRMLLVRRLFAAAQLGDTIYRRVIPQYIYSIAKVSRSFK